MSSGPKGEGGERGGEKKEEKKSAPDNYFDEKVEDDKEFLDMVTAMSNGGLANLVSQSEVLNPEELGLDSQIETPAEFAELMDLGEDDDDSTFDDLALEDVSPQALAKGMYVEDASTEGDAVGGDPDDPLAGFPETLKESMLIPPEAAARMPVFDGLNGDDENAQALKEFLPDTSEHKFTSKTKGKRACPGKRQRRGKDGVLRCHKIDLDSLSHLDTLTMRTFVSDFAEIKPRTETGLCAKCQRKVAKTIKRARNFGIMPHLDNFHVEDSQAMQSKGEPHHAPVGGRKHVLSKTLG